MQPFRLRAAAVAAALALMPVAAAAASIPPVPAADATLTQGSLLVQRFGNTGSPVVLIPGLACGPWEFAEMIAHLRSAHTVYALTLPGFDGRPAVDGPLMSRVESDVWALLDAQHIAKPLVVGHSLGGTLAIALAEAHPERLRGIVAIDGLPVFPRTEEAHGPERIAIARQISAALETTPEQYKANEYMYMQTAGGVLDPAQQKPAADLALRSDMHAVAAWLREDLTADLRPQLGAITVPMLEVMPYVAAAG